ncbi:MAG: hypothetical protein H7321_01420 [Bacteroidia bacterium]|nr:hypothetical protein [Bacteroidia bacterium]
MKRFAAILLTIFYFTCTTGISANLHFCGNNIAGISFGNKEVKSCCKVKESKCCSEKKAYYKFTVSHKPAPTPSTLKNISQPAHFVNYRHLNVIVFTSEINQHFLLKAQPDKSKCPLFIKNRTIVI